MKIYMAQVNYSTTREFKGRITTEKLTKIDIGLFSSIELAYEYFGTNEFKKDYIDLYTHLDSVDEHKELNGDLITEYKYYIIKVFELDKKVVDTKIKPCYLDCIS